MYPWPASGQMISARCPTFSSAINKNSLDNVFESSYVYFKVRDDPFPFERGNTRGQSPTRGASDGVSPFLSLSLSFSPSSGLYNSEGKNVCANIFRRSWLAFIRCSPATLDMNFRAASLCTCIPTIGRPYSPPSSRPVVLTFSRPPLPPVRVIPDAATFLP